jgi:tetratricopeptide (TPR) repeat protein
MKKTLLLATALSCLAMLGGCYQAQKQTPSPMGSEDTIIEERTIAGPFEEDLPGSAGASPSRQQTASRDAGADLESETSGAMKPPALEAIDGRIAAYGKKFARWNALNSASAPSALNREQAAEMADCYQRMKQLLAGYTTLRSAVESGDRSDVAANSMHGMKMQELQRTDIEFVEGSCGSLLSEPAMQQAAYSPGRRTAGLPLEAEMVSQSAAKNYKGVIQAWQQIPVEQQAQVSPRGRVLYAEALVYMQKEEEAAEIYRGMVEKMESDTDRPPDIFSLRKALADLYVGTGRFPEAQIQYIRISKDYLALGGVDNWAKMHLAILGGDQKSLELAEYSGLVRNYLGYQPEQYGYKIVWEAEKFLRTYPGSSVASNVETIKNKATEAADKWFNDLVAEIDRLAKEKKFQEAMAKIKEQRPDIINDQQVDLLHAKNDELVMAEAVEQETSKTSKLQELEQRWNNGMMLVKSARYDEAINVFNGMMDTEYAGRADAKISEISSLAARDDRSKAADLFIRYTRTADLESKKKLLIESRRLLKNILVKYPRADITDKVISNIQRVEQEMNAIDPQLITMADSQMNASQARNTGEQGEIAPEDEAFSTPPPIIETPAGQ